MTANVAVGGKLHFFDDQTIIPVIIRYPSSSFRFNYCFSPQPSSSTKFHPHGPRHCVLIYMLILSNKILVMADPTYKITDHNNYLL